MSVKSSKLANWLDPRTGAAADRASEPARQSTAVILIQLSDGDVSEAAGLISKVVDAIMGAEGTVFHIVSAIVVGAFDSEGEDRSNGLERCAAVAVAVSKELGSNCKVLYGMCQAVYGNFGSSQRMHYGPFIKEMSSLLKELHGLEYGEVRQFSGQRAV